MVDTIHSLVIQVSVTELDNVYLTVAFELYLLNKIR